MVPLKAIPPNIQNQLMILPTFLGLTMRYPFKILCSFIMHNALSVIPTRAGKSYNFYQNATLLNRSPPARGRQLVN